MNRFLKLAYEAGCTQALLDFSKTAAPPVAVGKPTPAPKPAPINDGLEASAVDAAGNRTVLPDDILADKAKEQARIRAAGGMIEPGERVPPEF